MATRRGSRLSPEFTKALTMLEGWGVSLLLAGEVDEAAMQTVTRRLLGDPTIDRYRILALLNDNDPAEYLPQQVTPGQADVRVLQYPSARSAVSATTSGDRFDQSAEGSGMLEVMNQDLISTCEELARTASTQDEQSTSGFRPGELRVVVDSLQPLIEAAGLDRVKEWLQNDPIPNLRGPRFRGRSHWMYYGSTDDSRVQTLMADPGLFEILVRVRRRQHHVEHQWVLRPDRFPHIETHIETPWMPTKP